MSLEYLTYLMGDRARHSWRKWFDALPLARSLIIPFYRSPVGGARKDARNWSAREPFLEAGRARCGSRFCLEPFQICSDLRVMEQPD
jgi:hypothetical protein